MICGGRGRGAQLSLLFLIFILSDFVGVGLDFLCFVLFSLFSCFVLY